MYFSEKTIDAMNKIMETASSEGRDMLYEYEVYGILELIGLCVPEHAFVENSLQLDEALLDKFRQSAVLKVVSPQIAHKQKLGGVKILHNLQTVQDLQRAVDEMTEEVLSHFGEGEKPSIKGFMVVEFVPFIQALGYETLFGIKEDPAFGPVLTLSKGGDDAEFFARFYDPANLMMPPFDMEQAMEVVNQLNIRHKFEAIGRREYLDHMAKAASLLSRLAYTFSYIAEEKPGYILKEMDINPFVITKDHRFVAVDGFARFAPFTGDSGALPEIRLENLAKFFNPKGIAVIGVSADMSKHSMGREIAHMLHDLGREDLYLVNARGGKIILEGREYALYKDISEIKDDIDLAVYAAPAQFTLDFVRNLPPRGPRAVIIISGIPSDMKYSDFTARMDEALPKGTRIIGPNCIGVFHAPDAGSCGINTFFLDQNRLEVKSSAASNTALLTQSGALAITVIDKMKANCLFKSVVSFGNKYDVKITDLIAYFAKEEGIELISLYVEGMDPGEGRRFFELAKTIRKPMLVYKSGKTEAGARAAASHTASMTGSYDVFKAACQQAGVILAEKIEDYEDYMKVFSLLSGKIPAGNRVAGVLNAGFESTVGADELLNLKQAQLSEETVEKLRKIDKLGLVDVSSSFLDVTPSADDRMFADFIEAVLQDENVDCMFVANVPHSHALKSDPVTCHDDDSLANLLTGISKKYAKPIVVSVNAGSYYRELVSIFEKSGLPVYSDIRSSIKSLDRFVSYHMEKKKTAIAAERRQERIK